LIPGKKESGQMIAPSRHAAIQTDPHLMIRHILTPGPACATLAPSCGQGRAGVSGRVLLIEDEPNIAEALRFVLGRDGWQVGVHADGATALAHIRQQRPDVVILDLMLPGASGLDILTGLRADAGMAAMPVLMLTAKGQDRDRAAAEAAGVTRFMTKPFANADIVMALREMTAS
jgi:CheY-like chemotaxis protein